MNEYQRRELFLNEPLKKYVFSVGYNCQSMDRVMGTFYGLAKAFLFFQNFHESRLFPNAIFVDSSLAPNFKIKRLESALTLNGLCSNEVADGF